MKPIKTEEEYEEYMQRIDALMENALPYISEGKTLNELVEEVMKYEDIHHPMS